MPGKNSGFSIELDETQLNEIENVYNSRLNNNYRMQQLQYESITVCHNYSTVCD